MEHQLAIFPVVSHRPQPGQSFRFCLVEYYRLFIKCSEIKFSGLHYRDFPKSKLGYVTFNFFLERDDSGKNFNQCNTKMVPNISCIHKNSFSRRRFGRSISDQHFSAQLHIALQKTHICTHTHTHSPDIPPLAHAALYIQQILQQLKTCSHYIIRRRKEARGSWTLLDMIWYVFKLKVYILVYSIKWGLQMYTHKHLVIKNANYYIGSFLKLCWRRNPSGECIKAF